MERLYDSIRKAIEEEVDKCRDYPSYIHTQVSTGALAWQKDYDKWKTRTPEDEITYKPVIPRRDTSDYADDEDDEYYYDDFDDYWEDNEDDYARDYGFVDYAPGTDMRTTEERMRDDQAKREAQEKAREDYEAQEREKQERETYINRRDDQGKIFGKAVSDFNGATRDVNQYVVKMGNGSQLILDVNDIVSIEAKSLNNYTKATKKELSKMVHDCYNACKPDAPIWKNQEVLLKACDDMKEFCQAKELNQLKKDVKNLTKPLKPIANNLELFIEKYDL